MAMRIIMALIAFAFAIMTATTAASRRRRAAVSASMGGALVCATSSQPAGTALSNCGVCVRTISRIRRLSTSTNGSASAIARGSNSTGEAG